jgi:hypothetical protein
VTEEEWVRETNPDKLAEHLRTKMRANRTKSGRRKFHLLACAACRRLWHLFESDLNDARVIEAVEELADGRATAQAVHQLDGRVQVPTYGSAQSVGLAVHAVATLSNPLISATGACQYVAQAYAQSFHPPSPEQFHEIMAVVQEENAHLARCIFGNPFRPATLDPAWRTPTVVALAKGIYEERAFDRLPILADALQDAGCDSEDVLNHCRDAGPHARGCWVVDLVLGKA